MQEERAVEAARRSKKRADHAREVSERGRARIKEIERETARQVNQRVAEAQKLSLDSVGDAFRPSAVWLGAARQTAATTELVDAVKEFQQKNHKLTMVIKQSRGGIAVIDGVTLSVGQSFDGFRLVAVRDASAVLRRGSQKLELRLLKDDGQAGGATAIAPAAPGTGTSEKFAGAGGGN